MMYILQSNIIIVIGAQLHNVSNVVDVQVIKNQAFKLKKKKKM